MIPPKAEHTRFIAAIAKRNGCRPEWSSSLIGPAWCCTCEDNTHGLDQQCSAISVRSAGRKKARVW